MSGIPNRGWCASSGRLLRPPDRARRPAGEGAQRRSGRSARRAALALPQQVRRAAAAVGRQWMCMFRRALIARGRDVTETVSRRSCMVLAPHPDDETLGCGATIALKRAAGADVTIVFATDGRHSHAGRIDGAVLAQQRRREALRAARALGVPAASVHFLNLEDGRLDEHTQEAAVAVQRLLEAHRPEELFVCTSLDGHRDHVALCEVVTALRQDSVERGRGGPGAGNTEVPRLVYEYPVWFWSPRAWRRGGLTAALAAQLRALRRLRVRLVRTGPYLERKRTALSRHESQMIAPPEDPGWPTLDPWLVARCCGKVEVFFEQAA